MIRVWLFICLAVAPTSTLDCSKCSVFSYEGMTGSQSNTIGTALTALGSTSCSTSNTVVTCAPFEDECHNITVQSTIGGDTMHSGSLLQCGTSSVRDELCGTYTNLAGMFGIVIDSCRIDSCTDDECFDPSQQEDPEPPQMPDDETPTLYCYKCYDLPLSLNDTMTFKQAEIIEEVLDILGVASCSDPTAAELITPCGSLQDECNNITVSSTLGGDTLLSGSLLQCGESATRNNLCATWITVAGEYDITIANCQTKACSEDTCFTPSQDNTPSGSGSSESASTYEEGAPGDSSNKDDSDNGTSISKNSLFLILISLATYLLASSILC